MFDNYSEHAETKLPALPSQKITLEVAEAKLKLALNQAGLQKLQTKVDSLIFNEDHLTEIAETLKGFRSMDTILEKEFKAIKLPYKEGADICDVSRRNVAKILSDLVNNVQAKYDKLCRDIAEQKRLAKIEEDRIAAIKQGIDSNMLLFSQKIAGANTFKEILSVESLINLEKSRKTKYAEFYDEAVLKFETLTAKIKDQKEKIKQLEEIERQNQEALKNNDEEKQIELMQQKETVQQQVEENKENIQLAAIESVTNVDTSFVVPEVILPKVKVRYSSWKWELQNIEKYQSKLPSYLKVVANEEVIEAKLKALKESKVLENKTELIWEGIRFYLDVRY